MINEVIGKEVKLFYSSKEGADLLSVSVRTFNRHAHGLGVKFPINPKRRGGSRGSSYRYTMKDIEIVCSRLKKTT